MEHTEFRRYSRSVEAQNCCSDRRETGTRSHTESEVPIVLLTKSENQTLKNGKSANHEKHHNRKTEFFFAAKTANPKNPKPPRWDYHSYDYLKNILCHHEDWFSYQWIIGVYFSATFNSCVAPILYHWVHIFTRDLLFSQVVGFIHDIYQNEF